MIGVGLVTGVLVLPPFGAYRGAVIGVDVVNVWGRNNEYVGYVTGASGAGLASLSGFGSKGPS